MRNTLPNERTRNHQIMSRGFPLKTHTQMLQLLFIEKYVTSKLPVCAGPFWGIVHTPKVPEMFLVLEMEINVPGFVLGPKRTC